MDLVVHGIDRGLPARFVEHHYRLDGDRLLHFTDGQLRAEVKLEHVHDFVADHPEVATIVRHLVPDVETRAAESKLARAKELSAIRQRPAGLPDQSAIDKVVNAAVARALAEFQDKLAAQLKATAPATSSAA